MIDYFDPNVEVPYDPNDPVGKMRAFLAVTVGQLEKLCTYKRHLEQALNSAPRNRDKRDIEFILETITQEIARLQNTKTNQEAAIGRELATIDGLPCPRCSKQGMALANGHAICINGCGHTWQDMNAVITDDTD